MKVNDIVKVRNGSYSMTLIKGKMNHDSGIVLCRGRYRVLSFGAYPTNVCNSRSGTNDIMLVDEKNSDFVLFSQEQFCYVVTSASQPERTTQLEVIVPRGTKNVHLILE